MAGARNLRGHAHARASVRSNAKAVGLHQKERFHVKRSGRRADAARPTDREPPEKLRAQESSAVGKFRRKIDI